MKKFREMTATIHLKWVAIMLLLLPTLLFGTTSCSNDDDEFEDTYSSLFVKCDYFVDMLDVIYEHYDAFGSKASKTSDGKFTVTPIGRLIVVKRNSYASEPSYAEIEKALKNHYRNKAKVNDVYLNNGCTVTIDCRN